MTMEPKIKRKYRSFPISLTTSTATAVSIRFDDVAGASVILGSGGTAATSIDVWAADTPSSTHGRLYKDGSAISVTLSQDATLPRVYPLPDEAFACGSVKLVANNEAATSVSCVVMLKG